MAWKKTDSILTRRLNQKGLGAAVIAGQICQKAEKLYPGMFRAVSLKSGVLHLELERKNLMQLKLIQGKLISELNVFATEKKLPTVERIRLTFPEKTARITSES